MNENGPPRDHVQPDHADPDTDRPPLDRTLKSKTTWLRVLFMVLVVIIYGISRIVVLAVMLIQLGYVLFTGSTHKPLSIFGKSLAAYSYEIVLYLTFNTEVRPFPFDADWPTVENGGEEPNGGDEESSRRTSGHEA